MRLAVNQGTVVRVHLPPQCAHSLMERIWGFYPQGLSSILSGRSNGLRGVTVAYLFVRQVVGVRISRRPQGLIV